MHLVLADVMVFTLLLLVIHQIAVILTSLMMVYFIYFIEVTSSDVNIWCICGTLGTGVPLCRT